MKKLKIFIIALALILTLGAFFALKIFNNPEYNKYAKQGALAYKNKDYKTAIINLEKAAAIKEDYNILCTLGISYGMSGNSKKAEDIFNKAVKLSPDKWQAYTFLGDVKRAEGMTTVAIEYYKKAISLPSMPKEYIKNFEEIINTTIEEKTAREKKSPSHNNTAEINIDGWQKAYSKGNNIQYIVEYAPKGEDVLNYKWTKLVTINFFNHSYNFTADSFYNEFVNLLKKQAKSLNAMLDLKKEPSPKGEIYFTWSIAGRGEAEICRIFKTEKGLYIVHYAHKKPRFTTAEKKEAIKILNSMKEN